MALFDLGSVLATAAAIPALRVGTSNVNSLAVDTSGYSAVAFVTSVGAGNTNATINTTIGFWESDDNTIGNATAVASSRIISNPVVDSSNGAFIASVVPTKRYVFAELAPSAAFTSNVAVLAVLKANEAPTT